MLRRWVTLAVVMAMALTAAVATAAADNNNNSSSSSGSGSSPVATCAQLPFAQDKCAFVRAGGCTAGGGGGMIDYMSVYYCTFAGLPGLGGVLMALWMCLLFFMIMYAASLFSVVLAVVAQAMRMSPELAGVTLLALGNGAPDFFTAIAGVSGSAVQLVIGALAGAGLFVTVFVFGWVVVLARGRSGAQALRLPLLRDIILYGSAVLGIMGMCLDGKVYVWEPLLFVVAYVVFVGTVIGDNYREGLAKLLGRSQQRVRKSSAKEEEEGQAVQIEPPVKAPAAAAEVEATADGIPMIFLNDEMEDVTSPQPATAASEQQQQLSPMANIVLSPLRPSDFALESKQHSGPRTPRIPTLMASTAAVAAASAVTNAALRSPALSATGLSIAPSPALFRSVAASTAAAVHAADEGDFALPGPMLLTTPQRHSFALAHSPVLRRRSSTPMTPRTPAMATPRTAAQLTPRTSITSLPPNFTLDDVTRILDRIFGIETPLTTAAEGWSALGEQPPQHQQEEDDFALEPPMLPTGTLPVQARHGPDTFDTTAPATLPIIVEGEEEEQAEHRDDEEEQSVVSDRPRFWITLDDVKSIVARSLHWSRRSRTSKAMFVLTWPARFAIQVTIPPGVDGTTEVQLAQATGAAVEAAAVEAATEAAMESVFSAAATPSSATRLSTTAASATEAAIQSVENTAAAAAEEAASNAVEAVVAQAQDAEAEALPWNRERRIRIACNPPMSFLLAAFASGGVSVFVPQNGSAPMFLWPLLAGIVLSLAIWFTTSDERSPRWWPLVAVWAFGVCIIWIYLIANELVDLLETFANIFGVSQQIIGLTVLAFGNSFGDLVADTTIARRGAFVTALAGVFTGPILNLLISVSLALTIGASSAPDHTLYINPPIHHSIFVAWGFLLLALCITLVVAVFRNFTFPRIFGYAYVGLYVIALTVVLLVEAGFIPL